MQYLPLDSGSFGDGIDIRYEAHIHASELTPDVYLGYIGTQVPLADTCRCLPRCGKTCTYGPCVELSQPAGCGGVVEGGAPARWRVCVTSMVVNWADLTADCTAATSRAASAGMAAASSIARVTMTDHILRELFCTPCGVHQVRPGKSAVRTRAHKKKSRCMRDMHGRISGTVAVYARPCMVPRGHHGATDFMALDPKALQMTRMCKRIQCTRVPRIQDSRCAYATACFLPFTLLYTHRCIRHSL